VAVAEVADGVEERQDDRPAAGDEADVGDEGLSRMAARATGSADWRSWWRETARLGPGRL